MPDNMEGRLTVLGAEDLGDKRREHGEGACVEEERDMQSTVVGGQSVRL